MIKLFGIESIGIQDPQDEEPVARADCDHEIYRYDKTFEWEGRMLCKECWQAEVRKLLTEDPEQLAEEMMLDVVMYQ